MPSFDISSEMDWQELDNAINQVTKEVQNRFDFKGIKCEVTADQKAKTASFFCTEEGKLEALIDVFQTKLIKRGISLLSFDFQKVEPATGQSVRQLAKVQCGIEKEKAKEIVKFVKNSKIKVQSQIQDEQVRVSAKSRDLLQEAISLLKSNQDELKIPLQFGNFRD